MSRHIRYFFITLLLLLIQTQVMHLLTLEGITPDILVIWIVYIAVREGQLPATIWGFAIGMLYDLATGSFIGLSAFSKTLCGFSAGYFFNEHKTQLTLSSYRYLIIVMAVSMIHNTLYFSVFTRGSDIGLMRAIFQSGLATTFYTTTVTLLPMFAFSRRPVA